MTLDNVSDGEGWVCDAYRCQTAAQRLTCRNCILVFEVYKILILALARLISVKSH